MMCILDINSIYDDGISAKDMPDKHMVYENKPIDTKWMGMFGERETNSYKTNLLLLAISKTLTISRSNAFVQRYLVDSITM